MKAMAWFLYMILYKFLNRDIKLGKGTKVKNTVFIKTASLHNNVRISNSEIGQCSYIGEDCVFDNIKIGSFSSIAPRVRLVPGNHPTQEFVSTHPAFYLEGHSLIDKISPGLFSGKSFNEFSYTENGYFSEIGSDVWVGSDVIILDGVIIGDGAIIAAGSVVTKNVDPYSIVGGVPAKKIKDRFSKDITEFLLEFKWWEKEYDWIKENRMLFSDVEKFVKLNKK